MCAELRALQQSICAYATSFDVHALVPSQAGEVVKLCSQIEASVASMKALAMAKEAEGTAWKHGGYRDPADHVAQRTGMSPGRAKKALQTGQTMLEQPDLAKAGLAGELSPEQAGAVADGAAANPDKTKELIDKAKQMSMGELNQEIARTKAAATDLEQRRRRLHAQRYFKRWETTDGSGHAHLFGNPESATTVWQAIDPIRRHLVLKRREQGQTREPFKAIDHDALLILASLATGQDAELTLSDLLELGLFPQLDTTLLPNRTPTAHTPPATPPANTPDTPAAPPATPAPPATTLATAPTTPATPPGPAASEPDLLSLLKDSDRPDPKKKRRKFAGSPTKIIIRVDYDTLLRGYPLDGELCDIPGQGPIPVSLIDDLIAKGNYLLAVAFTRKQKVEDVYQHRRRPNTHQKTALELIFPECTVKGCTTRHGLQYDHRHDWIKTHYTVLDGLDGLCQHHHKLKTHKNWALTTGRGKRDLVPPDDPRHPRHSHTTTDTTTTSGTTTGADPPPAAA